MQFKLGIILGALFFFNSASSFKVDAIDFTIPSVTDFPIQSPRPGDSTIECYPGSNQSLEWVVQQWKNEQSLCSGTVDQACPGADMSKKTPTASFCYWKDQKKVTMNVNSSQMSSSGCNPDTDPNNLGGYSVYLTWTPRPVGNETAHPELFFKNMSQLRFSTGYQTNSVATGVCPSNFPGNPYGFSYMNAILGQYTAQGGTVIMFYQTILYDNRNIQPPYINCSFPNPTGLQWITIGEPITAFGLPWGQPGQTFNYSWDILPRVNYYFNYCLGADNNPSTTHFQAMFLGNELANSTDMTNTFINPVVSFIPPIPNNFNTPKGYFDGTYPGNSCSVYGWSCDPDRYASPLNIRILENGIVKASTLANVNNEPAVTSSCGNTPNHRFVYQFPVNHPFYDGQPHTVTVQAENIDTIGNATGIYTTLPNSTANNTVVCSPTPNYDVNRDNKIDILDLARIVNARTSAIINPYSGPEDVNGDSKLDVADLNSFLQNYTHL